VYSVRGRAVELSAAAFTFWALAVTVDETAAVVELAEPRTCFVGVADAEDASARRAIACR